MGENGNSGDGGWHGRCYNPYVRLLKKAFL